MAGRTKPLNYLAGRRFVRLKVVEETARRLANGQIVWLCRCKCGGTAEVATSNLLTGNTTSCGCVQVARSVAANRKGGVRWRKRT